MSGEKKLARESARWEKKNMPKGKVETPQEAQDRVRAAGGGDKEAAAAWRAAKNAEIERKKNDPRYNTGTIPAAEMARLNAERRFAQAEDRLRHAQEEWSAAKLDQVQHAP